MHGLLAGIRQADDEESIATIRRAIDLGASLVDTAMSYGAGHNEELVGRAINGRRDEVILATKFGIIRGKDRSVRIDGRPENVRGYCEASLRRLGTDHIDVYYQHRIDPHMPEETVVDAAAIELSAADLDQIEQIARRAAWAGSRQSFAARHTVRTAS